MKPLLALLAAALLTACGSTSSARPLQQPASAAPRLVDAASATFTVAVTNQSFIDPAVELEVWIDGTRLVKQHFPVQNQHYLVRFSVGATPGRHILKVTSDTGLILEKTFDSTVAGDRYAFVSYMNFDDYDAQHVPHRIRTIDCVFSDHMMLMA